MEQLPPDDEYDWGARAGSSAGLIVFDWIRPEGSLLTPRAETVGTTRIAHGEVRDGVLWLEWTVPAPDVPWDGITLDDLRKLVASHADFGDRLYVLEVPAVT